MFIDISTYIGHWPFRRLRNNTLNGLDELARRYGITHMVVSNINGLFYKNTNDANLELSEELAEYNGETKFLPLAIVNPSYPEWERDARNMIASGFMGFELCPLYHGYSLAPEMLFDEFFPIHRAAKVMELASELDVPVRICSCFENFRGRSHFDVKENISGDALYSLLSKNDDVHVFITGFSPQGSGEKLGELIKTRTNTYFDTTQTELLHKNSVESLLKCIKEEQLCFGSLSPFNYIDTNLLRIDLTSLDSEKVYKNPARAFKALR